MAKQLNTRIQNKIDTASNWKTADTNSKFTPLDGELIIYKDGSGNESKPKIKIGDGKRTVDALPFIGGDASQTTEGLTEIKVRTEGGTGLGRIVKGVIANATGDGIVVTTTDAYGIAHNTLADPLVTTSNTTIAKGSTFSADVVTADDRGHVTKITRVNYTLGDEGQDSVADGNDYHAAVQTPGINTDETKVVIATPATTNSALGDIFVPVRNKLDDNKLDYSDETAKVPTMNALDQWTGNIGPNGILRDSSKNIAKDKFLCSNSSGKIEGIDSDTVKTNLGINELKEDVELVQGDVDTIVDWFPDNILGVENGGTGSTTPDAARTALGLGNVATEDIVPISKGGTGKSSHTTNSVLLGNGTSAVQNIATASGAFYATTANGAPKFGTLPIEQGGTGETSLADAREAFGVTESGIRNLYRGALQASSCALRFATTEGENEDDVTDCILFTNKQDLKNSMYVLQGHDTNKRCFISTPFQILPNAKGWTSFAKILIYNKSAVIEKQISVTPGNNTLGDSKGTTTSTLEIKFVDTDIDTDASAHSWVSGATWYLCDICPQQGVVFPS